MEGDRVWKLDISLKNLDRDGEIHWVVERVRHNKLETQTRGPFNPCPMAATLWPVLAGRKETEEEREREGPGVLLCTDRPRKRRQAFFLFLRAAEGVARLLLLHKRINVKLSPSHMRGLRAGWLEAHRLNGRWNGERCHETPVPGKLTSTIIYAIIYFQDFMAPLLRALTLSLDSAASTFSRSRLLFSLSVSPCLSLFLFDCPRCFVLLVLVLREVPSIRIAVGDFCLGARDRRQHTVLIS